MKLLGLTVMHTDINYRSPRDILDHLNRPLGFDRPIQPESPIDRMGVEILTYADPGELFAQIREAVQGAMAAAFKPG